MDVPDSQRNRLDFGQQVEDLPPSAFMVRLLAQADSRAGGRTVTPLLQSLDLQEASSWQEALELACRRAGMRTRELRLSTRQAGGRPGHAAPVATWSRNTGWIALVEAGRGAVGLLRPGAEVRRIAAGELASLLGVEDEDADIPWLAVESGLSAAAARFGVKQRPFNRLVELVRPDRSDLQTIVLYAAFVGGLTLATPIAVQQLINSVAFGGLVQPVVVLALLLFAGLSFAATLSAFQAYLAETIQRRVFVRACVDLADRLPRVRLDAFAGRHGPEMVNRFFDLVTVQKSGASLLLDGTAVVLQTVAGLLILSLYHPLMLAFSVVLVTGILIVTRTMGSGATDSAIGESNAKYALAAWMEELARHPGTFRSRSARAYALTRADGLAAAWVEARRKHYRIVLRQFAGALGLQVIASTLVLGLGGFLVVSGELTLGQLVASEIIVTAVVAAVARFGKQLETFYDLLAAVDKVGVLLDLPLERDGGRSLDPRESAAAVEVREVAADRAGSRVLGDTSLRVAAGERVAITGGTTAARSALLDLICGLELPARGHVAVDGEDLRGVRLEMLREQVVCLRDPEVFYGSIIDNLRVGREPQATTALNPVLARLGLLDEIRSLPEGMETQLATEGVPLTRSQLMRLSIARAVLAQPRLLALDDAIVHLDERERDAALDVLFDEGRGWSLVVVSNCEAVLARCDRTIDLGPAPFRAAPTPSKEDVSATEAMS